MGQQTTVFKVVRNVGGVLISAIQGPITLKYKIGEPTKACTALPEAGPLAFHTFEHAHTFAKFEARLAYLYNQGTVFEVFEALGENVQPIEKLSRELTPEWRREFWKDPDEFIGVSVMDAPKGSVVTSSLTLVQKVWDSNFGGA